jgi:hypothetical protein
MHLACETCGRTYLAEPAFDGVQLVPSPDALTRLLMEADRVAESELNALVRKIAAVLESRLGFGTAADLSHRPGDYDPR